VVDEGNGRLTPCEAPSGYQVHPGCGLFRIMLEIAPARSGRMRAVVSRGAGMSRMMVSNGPLACVARTLRAVLPGVLLASLLLSCSPSGSPVPQADYATRIVGGWQGTVGEVSETITFNADGKFVSEVRPRGFISNTLGQGVTGTVRGTWQINANAITLNVTSAQDARLGDTATKSTIEKFEPNELVVKSDRGETSTFRRLL
jgi:hypothetical protein